MSSSSPQAASGTKVPVSALRAVLEQVGSVVQGKEEAIRLTVASLLAGGHVLLEDVPGTGKTTLARAVAASLDLSFQRVQFTSDLLPSDLLGVSIWSMKEERFRFTEGPVFHHVLLADELNRTSPRTQSALLEAMSEQTISVDGEARPLPQPFFVIATQNPMEIEGTYPLPESQLDRFLVRLRLGHPERAIAKRVLMSRGLSDPVAVLKPAMTAEQLQTTIEAVPKVRVDESIVDYLLSLIEATRSHAQLALGASTRTMLGLYRATQAWALLEGRGYVVPDDVKHLFLPCVAHRVIPSPVRDGGMASTEDALRDVLASVEVPD